MNIHEYQGKSILKSFGVAIQEGIVAETAEQAVEAAKKLKTDYNSDWVVVKAQIHAGGRGKGGGVKLAKNLDEVKEKASQIIGMNLITPQTSAAGKKVHKVLIAQDVYYPGANPTKEFYMSVLLDRGRGRNTIIYSTEGGMNIEEVAERLQDVGIKALAIHGRTRAQMYKGEADWELIGKVKNNPRIKIPIFGNGDIDSPQKAKLYKERYGVDGIMIGRAAIGYPWIFREIKHFVQTGEEMAAPTLEERIAVCKKHLIKSVEWKGPKVGIFEMRRHYANYLRGLPNIKEFRGRLVTLMLQEEIIEVLDELYNYYQGIEIAREPIELINYHENCPL